MGCHLVNMVLVEASTRLCQLSFHAVLDSRRLVTRSRKLLARARQHLDATSARAHLTVASDTPIQGSSRV